MIGIHELVEHPIAPTALWQATNMRLYKFHCRANDYILCPKSQVISQDALLEFECFEYKIDGQKYYLTRTKTQVTLTETMPKQLTLLLLIGQLATSRNSYDEYTIS